MIKLLTRKETEFLRELAVLLKEYDAVIAATDLLSVRVSVYEGDVDQPEENSIYFPDSFDESEIELLLEHNRKQAEQVKLEYADGNPSDSGGEPVA